ncbi:hypothetical protein EDB80DRAFT_456520 [Ilyonectria destructans]|nr:hypothetical protein EDB80DRAFT_456520 [Ilyonectria destructans]
MRRLPACPPACLQLCACARVRLCACLECTTSVAGRPSQHDTTHTSSQRVLRGSEGQLSRQLALFWHTAASTLALPTPRCSPLKSNRSRCLDAIGHRRGGGNSQLAWSRDVAVNITIQVCTVDLPPMQRHLGCHNVVETAFFSPQTQYLPVPSL